MTGRGSARWLRDYHAIAAIGWAVMIPVSIITGIWRNVGFITIISLWALVATEWGAWQGSRAEVMAEEIKVETSTASVTADTVNVQEHPPPPEPRWRPTPDTLDKRPRT